MLYLYGIHVNIQFKIIISQNTFDLELNASFVKCVRIASNSCP